MIFVRVTCTSQQRRCAFARDDSGYQESEICAERPRMIDRTSVGSIAPQGSWPMCLPRVLSAHAACTPAANAAGYASHLRSSPRRVSKPSELGGQPRVHHFPAAGASRAPEGLCLTCTSLREYV